MFSVKQAWGAGDANLQMSSNIAPKLGASLHCVLDSHSVHENNNLQLWSHMVA